MSEERMRHANSKRKCTLCMKSSSLSEFYVRKTGDRADLPLSICKSCSQISRNRWQKEHRKQVNETRRIWTINNPNKRKVCKRKSYIKNREKILSYGREYRKRNREKNNARSAVSYAIKYGKIRKPSKCSMCERIVNVVGHHSDYSKKLDVIWICKRCHYEVHHVLQ